MENGTTWGTWIAYGAICVFLLVLVVVVGRTLLLFSTLTLMPLNRVLRWVRGKRDDQAA